MNLGKIFKFFITIALMAFAVSAVFAFYLDIMPTNLKIHPKIYKSSGIAIDGYDAVNYQNKKSANKGNVTYKFKLNDNHWIFMSNANMKMFVKSPNRYIPQFGGFCTYSISEGYTYPPNPEVWKLHNGRLYLFKDEEAKSLAVANWKEVLKKAEQNWK